MTKRPFAVFDIDGTLIRWQLYHAIIEDLIASGTISSEYAEKIEAARRTWKQRLDGASFGDYEMTLVHTYHDLLASLPHKPFEEAVERVFELHKDQVYTYTRDLLRQLKSRGYLLFAISGSHQEAVTKLGDYYGFDATIGAHYGHTNGHFTGERSSPVDIGKGPLLKQLVEEWNASWEGSLAIGDSRSDAAMLELVEQPIAFNPNRELFEIAREQGWRIVVERKDMIYTLEQGDATYLLAETNA